MTLIEILVEYSRVVRDKGRVAGNQRIYDICEEALWKHIIESVDDSGNFIDAEGYRFNP